MSDRLLQLERLLVYVWGIIMPWQTIWFYRTSTLNGSVWQYATLGWYLGEIVLWLLFLVSLYNFRAYIAPTRGRSSLKHIFFLVLFFAFPLYAFLSIWWSLDFDASLRQALFIIEGYMLLVTIFISRVPFVVWVRAFLLGSIAPIVLGLYQWFSQSTFSSTLFGLSEYVVSYPGASIVASETIGRWLRAYGTFPHPNIFGGYLVFILVCTFLYSTYIQKKSERILMSAFHIIGVFALLVTFSRSAIFAYVFVCLGFLIYALRYRIKMISVLLVCSCVVFVIFGTLYRDLVYTRTLPTSISETRSISEREEGIVIAWQLYRENPVFGSGGGTFTHMWHNFDASLPGYLYQPAHVAFLVVLVEHGLVGAVFLLASVGLCLWYGLRRAEGRTGVLFLCGMVLPLVSIGLFDHYLITLYPGIMLFFAYFGIGLYFSTHSPQSLHK